mmetsp:Transcript_29430/g.59391  ORF Transcript_29430/g.59391 Transcript_29430/m.59391 type:complete len:207 (+) Transcript_29430:3-623(+)
MSTFTFSMTYPIAASNTTVVGIPAASYAFAVLAPPASGRPSNTITLNLFFSTRAARSNTASTTLLRPCVKTVVPSRTKGLATEEMRSREERENSTKRVPRSRSWERKFGVVVSRWEEERVTWLRKSSQEEERAMWERLARRYFVVAATGTGPPRLAKSIMTSLASRRSAWRPIMVSARERRMTLRRTRMAATGRGRAGRLEGGVAL